MVGKLMAAHDAAFSRIQSAIGDGGIGLIARLVFASVLLVFFLNSAGTKVGDGFPGIFEIQVGAYAQMLPAVAEEAGYDTDAISFIPYGLIVIAGTLGEVLLPLMITAGLLTRLASLGMICFVAVMTYVDITGHGAEPETIGAPFDRLADAAIWDQRLLWCFLLLVLVAKGGGYLSLDRLFGIDRPRN